MTLEILQKEMITALKNGNKLRKDVISNLVGAVKKAGIDQQCRDNIPESLVNNTLLKEQKTMHEMIATCPSSRMDLHDSYVAQLAIIDEFAPKLLSDPEQIKIEILSILSTSGLEIAKKNKGAIMKIIMPAFKGRADMTVVNKVISEILSEN